jgi:hypothetical protein
VSDQPLFWKGNQDPSITETITSNGLPVDLTGMSVKFKMRAVNSSTLKVDAAVSNTPDATGVVRYDWSAPDVNTAGQFLMWWEVTDTQGHTQDMSEAVIEFRAHTPLTNGYVELEQFKSTAELTGSSFADQDIQNAIVSASRWIDYETSTKFWPDTVDQTRYFTANGASVLRIDDLISLTTLTTDTDDNGTFDYTWTVNTDFVLEPKNAVQNGFPYNSIRRLRSGARIPGRSKDRREVRLGSTTRSRCHCHNDARSPVAETDEGSTIRCRWLRRDRGHGSDLEHGS